MDTNTNTNTGTDTPTADTPSAKPVFYARFPRSFGFEFALHVFLGPPLLVLWSFVAYYYYIRGAISFPILKVSVYYSAGFALLLLLYGNNRATRRGRGVILDGERIVDKGGGVSMLEYADIRGVSCSKNPLFSKKMILAMSWGKASLPLNLNGSYKMVETVLEKLAAAGRLNENEEKAAVEKRRLYVKALQYNALYKERERHQQSFIAVSAASAIFNGLVAALYWERGLATALAWGFAGMLFQALGYLAAERFWAWKLFDRGNAGGGINADAGINKPGGMDGLYDSFKAAAALAALEGK